MGFGDLFGDSLFDLKVVYIAFANSKLRFMYSAKSAELIGESCDAAIFRFLRSVTSLWNLFRYVIVHHRIVFGLQKYEKLLD